jgi:hypothetical protein
MHRNITPAVTPNAVPGAIEYGAASLGTDSHPDTAA